MILYIVNIVYSIKMKYFTISDWQNGIWHRRLWFSGALAPEWGCDHQAEPSALLCWDLFCGWVRLPPVSFRFSLIIDSRVYQKEWSRAVFLNTISFSPFLKTGMLDCFQFFDTFHILHNSLKKKQTNHSPLGTDTTFTYTTLPPICPGAYWAWPARAPESTSPSGSTPSAISRPFALREKEEAK